MVPQFMNVPNELSTVNDDCMQETKIKILHS